MNKILSEVQMWHKGDRRRPYDPSCMIAGLLESFSLRQMAEAAGVSVRTVRHWRDGEWHADAGVLQHLFDRLFPVYRHVLPIYRADMAIDGYTRVGGVGEYSRRSARGL